MFRPTGRRFANKNMRYLTNREYLPIPTERVYRSRLGGERSAMSQACPRGRGLRAWTRAGRRDNNAAIPSPPVAGRRPQQARLIAPTGDPHAHRRLHTLLPEEVLRQDDGDRRRL